jgi:hypothetical protein
MRIAEENWKVVASLFPAGWHRMAWQSGAVKRLRGFPSPDVLLRMLMLHMARCDFFEVTATIGEGSGESLNRIPVAPHELILADAGYCSIAGIEYVWQHGADVLVRINLRASLRILYTGGASPSFRDYARCPRWGSSANGKSSCMVKVQRLRAGCAQ